MLGTVSAVEVVFGCLPDHVRRLHLEACLWTCVTAACDAEKFEEGQSFRLHETHFDIIMEAPPMLTVLGSSKNTPIQMCCVADHFLGESLTSPNIF